MSDDRRKRSRFDQVEPEPARKSRFDRRSRSPAREDAEPQRSRSPIDKSTEATESAESAAKRAAAAAAAKINESIQAKKGLQQVDVPPILSSQSPATAAGAAKSPSEGPSAGPISDEIYQQDGDFIRDMDVNDLRNRYTLTKGATQKMIKEKTGADVTTRGNYYPDRSMATPANPPLYLHVTSTSKEGLEKAVKEIEELMKQDLPNLIDERRFRRREAPEPVERDHLGRRKWPEERIPIDLEPIHGFNLRAQVVGAGGSYVKYIQQETGCRVQIKGRGSGYLEQETGRESDEQMYLHVAAPDASNVEHAKNLCKELLDNVRSAYDAFKERGGRGGGDRGRGAPDDHRGGYSGDRNGSGGAYGSNGQQYGFSPPQQYGGDAQPATAAVQAQGQEQGGSMDPAVAAWVQYYAANPDQDPYIQYGGYGAMMAQYYQGQQGAMQQTAGYAGMAPQHNGAAIPPPPDAGDDVPPPPPPPGT